MCLKQTFIVLLLCFSALLVNAEVVHAEEKPLAFTEAQMAAAEGRYEDVVAILSAWLESKAALIDEDRAIALSNRGIAYSLLKRYGLALQDLNQAIRLQPEHLLTLNHLGILAEHVDMDYVAAAEWYGRAATLGYPASQVNLGHLFREGLGVERAPYKAVELYSSARDQGYDPAFVALGEMYLEGNGVERDAGYAVELLREGVSRGVITGHHYLGMAYQHGIGVAQDFETAFAHYYEAAIVGYAPSQGAIGYLYRRGDGVPRSFVEAMKWYRLAAEQGDVPALTRIAWLLATCPEQAICDGEMALEYAAIAVRNRPSPSSLDSLAAAYARLGQFDRAVQIMGEVLADVNLSAHSAKKYQARIERYRNGIPSQL